MRQFKSPGPLFGSALQSIRSKAGRAALSCLSLVLGVLSIVVVEVASSIAAQVVLQPAELQQGRSNTWEITAQATPQSIQAASSVMRQWPGDAALLVTDQSVVVHASATGQHLQVNTYAGRLRSIRPFPVLHGKWPTDRPTLTPALAVNKAASALGDLRIQPTPGSPSLPVHVSAVVDDGSSTPQIWIPLQQLRSRAGAEAEATIHVIARLDDNHAASIQSRLNSTSDALGLRTNGAAQRVDTVDELAATLDTMRTTFLIVGGVTLLVGVIGILNIGLATLSERAEEFALRRSLGATRGDVAVLVLAESMMIGLLGATTASGVSWALYKTAIPVIADGVEPDAFPLQACIVGLAVGAGAGLLGGAIPAFRAARLPIAVVMRA
ncbi:ABC transporter permease [Streptomyces sp. STCH 565 A]|uniref:ABC transporter permease n=1 Tax=Streptomyces sp. STCH 565 A TaxID=2950532 RepID=UPI002074E93D|nr:ABC transporter permease [Streptomyces sp. STCH 565 A]MCM8555976.1 ABC transporter permease [Streptomyces sp. STCH 565 A]